MMMRVSRLIAIAGAVLLLVIGATAHGSVFADAPIVYRLCKGDVQAVEMHAGTDKFTVAVKLTDSASAVFATLTETHVGKRLLVVAGDTVLSKATVRARIDSGRVMSRLLGESEATELLALIRERLPEAPCAEAQHGGGSNVGEHRGAQGNAQ